MDPNTQQDPQGTQGDAKYSIPDAVLEKYGDLVELIKKTESMSEEEREYWFQILPIMTEEQVTRLRKILEEESKQLAQLDQEYQSELSELNKKHLAEWDNFEKKKEREAREAEEQEAETAEQAAEAALLEALERPEDDQSARQ